jgi:hypothetical protein
MVRLEEYYEDPAVRARMWEFLGGLTGEEASCAYIATDLQPPHQEPNHIDPGEIWSRLAHGGEVMRSLWDRQGLIVHIDLEYVNFDYPGEPYLNPDRMFVLQMPTVRKLQELLLEHHIAPLHLLSGRGHHLVWQVRADCPVLADLAGVGRLPNTLVGRYAAPQPPHDEIVPAGLGAAYAGMGMVLEYVGHRLLQAAQPLSSIPITLTEVETSEQHRGREIISVDLSEYGDPLHTRIVRVPFSAYHKPRQQQQKVGEHVVEQLPPLFVIPLFEMDHRHGCQVMRDVEQVAQLARVASARIPDESAGTVRLVESYRRSDVAQFHRWFYSQEHERPEHWPDTYDRTALEPLPACARRILQQPNDLLLKPVGMRHLVRVLLALGWHPRHIAGLVRSKFERDYGWGNYFFLYDAATRADFYTRLFTGLIITGMDDLSDFQCLSAQMPRGCDDPNCSDVIAAFSRSLRARRDHERLASRPFHGLFLPD